MNTLIFNGVSFTVDHAVKGADYIHGFDASGALVVAFEGVTDFSGIEYDGEYLSPEECAGEPCNVVKYVGGRFVKVDGTPLTFSALVNVPNTGWSDSGNYQYIEIPCTGILEADNPIVDVQLSPGDPDANKLLLEAWSHIQMVYIPVDDNVVLFTDGELPTTNFTMLVKVVR